MKTQSESDQLAAEEKNQISQSELFRAAYSTLTALRFASYNPEQFAINMGFKIYPGEKDFSLTAENIMECLKVYSINVTKEVVRNILEAGFLEAVYFKRERKNEKGEVIATAFSLARND